MRSLSTYHCKECVFQVTPGKEGNEAHEGESSEETFRKFHPRFIKWMCVLRPQRGTVDKHFHGSLSGADRSMH